MIYLLYGTLTLLIENYIKKIIKSEKINDLNIVKYTINDEIDDIIEDANTISLFATKKLIVINNPNLFIGKKTIDTTNLEKYLTNKNPDTILIFVLYEEKIDTRRKLYKEISKVGKIEEFNKISNINQYVKKLFDGYVITGDNINLLLKRVGTNLNTLNNEIDKLKLYKDSDHVITEGDIMNCTIEKIDINIFKFIDNIIKNDKKETIKIYKELLRIGEEPIKIITLLVNQFRLMYQVKCLTAKGYSEDDIASLLHVKRYPVHLAIQKSYHYSKDILIKNLNDLAELDIQIKSGEIDKNLALELFLLKI